MRNRKELPPLTIELILSWADSHKKKTGGWPKTKSGQVIGTSEIWNRIDSALQQGQRGLDAGSSLAKLLAEYRGVRHRFDLSDLTIRQILFWVDAHKAETGEWPNQKSGPVKSTDEKWAGIDAALSLGRRGLPRGSSLAKLLAEHRAVRNVRDLPPLTIKQILTWANEHMTAFGDWPNAKSGPVTGTDETWDRINNALHQGQRGLAGGASLRKLLGLRRVRGKRKIVG